MNTFLLVLDILIATARTAVFWIALVAAALAALSFLARSRRLSPFGAPARFVRANVDPLFAPVERRVLRAGGTPTSAPWWGVAAVVIGGIVLVTVLGFIRQQALVMLAATAGGTRGLVALLVSWTFGVLRIALLLRVISSWFQLSPYSPWIRWAFALTDWILNPLRQVIPSLGMIDVTPIVAYFLLSLLEGVVRSAI